MNKNLDRFLKYVKIDTQSSNENCSPSTNKQFDLANLLVEELKQLGVTNARVNDKCIVYASIPSNTNRKCKAIGFNAHLDTALDLTGTNVNPQVIENYDGGIITLSKKDKIHLDPKEYPSLLKQVGHTLVTTSGDTLLGADDKAGITIIMGLVDFIYNNPSFEHGEIFISFTPDEEVGRGTENFDLKEFKADFAYTLDGSQITNIEYECFNATSAHLQINGLSIHPGTAKGKMVNAIDVAMQFHSMLPEFAKPQYTELYEGFNHIHKISGSVDSAVVDYIIRNHDRKLLEKQKQEFIDITKFLNTRYGYEVITLTLKDSYKNMKEYLVNKMYVVDIATKAIESFGNKVTTLPIRGGTDGAALTFMGLPCPNLGTGGYNYHGRYEYISLNELTSMIDVLIKILELTLNS